MDSDQFDLTDWDWNEDENIFDSEEEEIECLELAHQDGFDVFAPLMAEYATSIVEKGLMIQAVCPIDTRWFLVSMVLESIFNYRTILGDIDPEAAEAVDRYFLNNKGEI